MMVNELSGPPLNACLQISFEVGILTTFGHLEPRSREELKKNYRIVDAGYNSFPTCIPGTQYKKALLVSNTNSLQQIHVLMYCV